MPGSSLATFGAVDLTSEPASWAGDALFSWVVFSMQALWFPRAESQQPEPGAWFFFCGARMCVAGSWRCRRHAKIACPFCV